MSSNLGVVELTVALHRALDLPQDKILFDVGHQCYTHKLLTGRMAGFAELRQKNGLSGFPNPKESPCDTFIAGHGSAALSTAIGIARAKKLKGEPGKVVVIVGDGAFTGGMVYEGMNNVSQLNNLILSLIHILLVAVGLLGLVLLGVSSWLPAKSKPETTAPMPQSMITSDYEAHLEARLQTLISNLAGAGETRVMVTLQCGEESIYAADTETSADGTAASKHVITGGTGLVETIQTPQVQGVAVPVSYTHLPSRRGSLLYL